MAEYTKIERDFWESDEARDMTPEEKYFWFYLQTNANVNTLGCYTFRMRRAMDETGYNQETIEKLLQRMADLKRILWDMVTGEVYLLHFAELYWNKKTATLRAIHSALKDVKSKDLKEILLCELVQKEIITDEATMAQYRKEQAETTKNGEEHLGTNGNKRGEKEEEEEEEEEKRKTEKKKAAKPSFIPAMIDKDTYSLEFQMFWEAYPNKKNKQEAVKRWDKLKITTDLFRQIMEGLTRAKNSYEWGKNDGEFIPHPARWLNVRGWENEYKPMAGGGQQTPAPARPPQNDALAQRRGMMG